MKFSFVITLFFLNFFLVANNKISDQSNTDSQNEKPHTESTEIVVNDEKNIEFNFRKSIEDKVNIHKAFINEQSTIIKQIPLEKNQNDTQFLNNIAIIQETWKSSTDYIVQLMTSVNFGITEPESALETDKQKLHKEWQNSITDAYTLFRDVNKKRAYYYTMASERNISYYQNYERLFQAFLKEFILIPYKAKAYFLWQKLTLLNNLKSGYKGFYAIFIQIITLLLFIFSPLILYFILKKALKLIQNYQKILINKSYRDRAAAKLALVIQYIIPYFPWVFLILSLNFFKSFIEYSPLPALSYFLPYFLYYFYYRIFRIFIESRLAFLVRQTKQKDKTDIKNKLDQTSKVLGLSFFFIFSFKNLAYSALGTGIVFQMTQSFTYYFSWLLIFYMSSKWKTEIVNVLSLYQNHTLASKLLKLTQTQYISFFIVPVSLVFIFTQNFLNIILQWGQKVEWIKIIYTKILRVRIEGTQKKSELTNRPLPQEYLDNFLKPIKAIEVKTQKELIASVKTSIVNWIEEKSYESSIAISGERGIGKTFVLNSIKSQFDLPIIHIDIPEKRLNKKALLEFLSEQLQLDLSKHTSNLDYQGPKTKTLVLLDNVHNLFLSKIGGFDAYQSFLDIVNLGSKNIFWLTAFNEQSWIYLESVLGSKHIFRKKLKFKKWNEDELNDLITEHHQLTHYSLKYDNVLYATTSINNDIESAETRFFRLLWEQSNGNPSVAKELWLHSINLLWGKTLKVGLPRDYNSDSLPSFHADLLFVFSSLLRHDNLTLREAMQSTNLTEGIVRQALNRGVEEGFIEKISPTRYRVSIKWFYFLLRFLRSKNYLYVMD